MIQASNTGWEPEADPEYGQRLIPYLLGRYRWLLAGLIILGALVFGIAALFAPPSYSTRGSLHITKGSSGSGVLRNVPFVSGSAAPLHDEILILRSREIGLKVINELGLQVDVYDPKSADAPWQRVVRRFFSGGDYGSREEQYSRLTVRDVTVSPDMLGSKQRWITADASGNWTSDDLSGDAGEPLTTDSYSFLPVFGPAHQAGDRYLLTIKPDFESWQQFRSGLTVKPASIDTNVVEVRFAHVNPLIAKQVVALVLQTYLEFNQQKTFGDLDALLDFIAGETQAVETRLEQLTTELSKYREERHVYAETAQGSTAVQSMANLSSNRTSYEIELRQIDNVLSMIKERTPAEVSATIQAPATNLPIEQELVSRLAELIQSMKTARQTMTEEHPRVRDLNNQITTVLGQIEESLVTARANTRLAIGSLSGDISLLQTQLEALPEASGKIALLSGEIEANQQVLALLREQEADAKLRRAGTSTEVRLLDAPPMPARRDKPRIMRDVALGMVAGALVAVLILLVVESSRRGFRSLRELRSGLGLRILGVLPGQAAGKTWQPVEIREEYGRRLLGAVITPGEPAAVVYLGSPISAISLCWALTGRHGQPETTSLLIDADGLRGAVSRALQRSGAGLGEACGKPERLPELVQQLDEFRRLLPPGEGELTPESLKQVLATAKARYSRTVICLPLPAQWTDQAVWRAALDQVVLAVPQGAVSRGEIQAVLGQLQDLGISVRGAVVTGFSSARDPLAREELAQIAVPPLGRA